MDFWKMTPWQIFSAGGPLMWPVLVCSIISFAITLERFFYLARAKIDAPAFLNKIVDNIKHNRIKEALDLCDRESTPVSRMLKTGVLKHDRTREKVKETLEDASLYEIPLLEKRMTFLATIAHISPLIGLLGTVTGMVRAFQTIQVKAGAMNAVSPADLAGGIWEALLTTVFGLLVAIPTFIFYNILVSKINSVVLDMERTATELVNFLTE
ncbi:MAG TPA: MotA/TolQ/ExbB proton channel family protein [Candidatus Omnitrophica bacterium]|nr:MotA/TolQ/ExbB proton channel family protein [Candidatus Omnitrophota bacterium]